MTAGVTRLAVVSDAVYPWNTGGKEVRHHELLTRLVHRQFVVDVYTMHWWSERSRVHHADGITYHAICPRLPLYSGSRRSILQAVVFALATVRLLVHRYDVVEVDAIPFLPIFPMRLVCWLRRKPMVVTWHEFWGVDYWRRYLGPVRGSLAAAVERVSVRLPDRVIAASGGTAERIGTAASGRRVPHVVPNGVCLAELDRIVGQPGGAELVIAGRLLPNKNVDVAISALSLMRRDGLPVRLRIIGDGPERERLGELALALGLGDVVDFEGFISRRSDLLRALADARVLLFPSVREGFGMVALEALALGTPVVTSDHPDNFARTLVNDSVNGATCPAEPECLARATTRVLGEHVRLGLAARESARSFDWELLSESVSEVYRQ